MARSGYRSANWLDSLHPSHHSTAEFRQQPTRWHPKWMNRYSRHFSHPQQSWSDVPDGPYKRIFPANTLVPGCRTHVPQFIGRELLGCQNGFPKVNSHAPFVSLYKATCGVLFDEVSLSDTATDEFVHPRRGLRTRHPPTVLNL